MPVQYKAQSIIVAGWPSLLVQVTNGGYHCGAVPSKIVGDITMQMPSTWLQQSARSCVSTAVGRDSCLSFVGATGRIISLGLSHVSLRGLCTQQHSYASNTQASISRATQRPGR